MRNGEISSAIVQEFIGHDSPAINAHTTHIETSALRKAGGEFAEYSLDYMSDVPLPKNPEKAVAKAVASIGRLETGCRESCEAQSASGYD